MAISSSSGKVPLSKAEARQLAWDRLQDRGLARFPFPPHGRIPNFAAAREAAQRLFDTEPFAGLSALGSGAIKVNPDSPQMHVRYEALARGLRVYVPTPKLRGGFMLLDPAVIAPASFKAAATMKTCAEHAQAVALTEIEPLDAIVTGCAAVTLAGKRCGKGAGYSDIEYALLRELGHPDMPVATTVHDVQIIDDFPIESNDLPLSLICTPEHTYSVAVPLAAPSGIEWDRVSEEDLENMIVLRELKRLKERQRAPHA